MGILIAIILGSGIELDPDRIRDINVLKRECKGVHNKLRYTCTFEGREIFVLQGRKHFYEGYKYNELTEDIRLVKEMGAANLIITNAAGGVNNNFNVSDLMLIRSFVNLNSRLVYKKNPFPYDIKLAELFLTSCSNAGVAIHEGVYGYYQGPTYETKAEVRFQRKYNIDAAGMSTIPESSEASLNGIKVAAVSVITNILKENNLEPADHETVISSAKAASGNLNKALSAFISQLN
jgi:purine-nucleoside phosphorylase